MGNGGFGEASSVVAIPGGDAVSPRGDGVFSQGIGEPSDEAGEGGDGQRHAGCFVDSTNCSRNLARGGGWARM
jgi:hypothetical protein